MGMLCFHGPWVDTSVLLTRSHSNSVFQFWGLPSWFPMSASLTSPLAVREGSDTSTSSPTLGTVHPFHQNHRTGCDLISRHSFLIDFTF